MARLDGHVARVLITVLILITTFAVAYVGVASAACCVLDLDQVVKALSVAGQGNRVKK